MARSYFEHEIDVRASLAVVGMAMVPQGVPPASQYRYMRTVNLRLGPVALPVTYEVTLTVHPDNRYTSEAAPAPGVRTRSSVRCTPISEGTRVTVELDVEAPSFILNHVAQQLAESQLRDLERLREQFEAPRPVAASPTTSHDKHDSSSLPTVSFSRAASANPPAAPSQPVVEPASHPVAASTSASQPAVEPASEPEKTSHSTTPPVPRPPSPSPIMSQATTSQNPPAAPASQSATASAMRPATPAATMPQPAAPPIEKPVAAPLPSSNHPPVTPTPMIHTVLPPPPVQSEARSLLLHTSASAQPRRRITQPLMPSSPEPHRRHNAPISRPTEREEWPYTFQMGDVVRSRRHGWRGVVIDAAVIHEQVYYTIALGDEEHTLPESDLEQPRDVIDRLADGKYGYASDFDLYMRATALQCAFQQRGMSCLSNSRLDPRPHQVFVAHRVLQDLYPRYLLADEVGLGKTIEAGLILKELRARGLAQRVLIVVPASLCEQWRGELETKFNETFHIYNGAVIRDNLNRYPNYNPWERDPSIITSLQFARGQISAAHQPASWQRRAPQAVNRWIDEVEWDLVIFDEAHHLRRYLKNGSGDSGREVTQSYRLAQAVEERTRSLLLLTATPLQLTEYDAFSLFELLDPTVFPTYRAFCDYVFRLGRQHWQALGELDRVLHALESSHQARQDHLLGERFRRALLTCRTLTIYEDFWNSLVALVGGDTVIGSDGRYTLEAIRHSYTTYFEQRDDGKVAALTTELEQHGLREFLYLQCEPICDWIGRQHKLSQIMIRNRKREVLRGEIVNRHAYKIRVMLTDEERALYKAVSAYIKSTNARITGKTMALGFILTTFRKLLVSSRQALAASFERRAARLEAALQKSRHDQFLNDEELDELASSLDTAEDLEDLLGLTGTTSPAEIQADIELLRSLVRRARSISVDSKAQALIENVRSILQADPREKMLIFTQFRQTQSYLKRLLEEAGYRVVLFHGEQGSTGYTKRAEFSRFKRDPEIQIMISTDVGGEGLNFQFCRVLFNYDLPWNPMNIEQRIGRLDRIGQKRDVHIYNFLLDGTIDGRILDVLQERIRIFEETIGTLDPIIGEEIESVIRSIALADTEIEAERRLRDLAVVAERRIREAREAEEKLADFIMDARSFRRDTVDQILGRPQSVTNHDIEILTRSFLERYRRPGRPDHLTTIADHIYTIAVPAAFREMYKQHSGIELRSEYIGTFHAPTAIAEETIDFFAFGHPLFDAIVRFSTDRAHNGFSVESALRVVYDDELAGYEGVQFNYLVVSDGVRTYRTFVPVVLDRAGTYSERIAQRIFELRADEKAAEGIHLSFDSPTLRALKRRSSAIIQSIAAQEFEAAEERNLREFAEVHAKLRRMFEYRLEHQREELDIREQQLAEARSSHQENRMRLMQGQVNATQRRIRELEAQRDAELAKLADQHELKPGIQLLNVALVKVLPTQDADATYSR